MISLGLSSSDQSLFNASLAADHKMRVRVTLMDLSHNVVGVADDVVLTGQVDFHAGEATERSLSVSLLDRGNALGLDSGNPSVASGVGSRMLQVHYGVWSDRLPRWVDVPVFTGPITKPKRSGDVLTLACHSRESKLLGACSLNARWGKGARVTDIIRGLLEAGRVARMEIPDLSQRSTVDTVVGPLDSLWARAQGWARALGMRLAFDGLGVARLTSPSPAAQWVFRGGDGGMLMDEPDYESDVSVVRNLVVVTGGEAKHQGVARLPASHPMSYENQLAWLREDVEADVASAAAAKVLATAKLREFDQAGTSVQANVLPVPHLEPLDRVTVQAATWSWTNPVQSLTLPLVADGVMSLGHHGVVRAVHAGRGRR